MDGIEFIPEAEPKQDETEALAEAKADDSEYVSHDEMNWG